MRKLLLLAALFLAFANLSSAWWNASFLAEATATYNSSTATTLTNVTPFLYWNTSYNINRGMLQSNCNDTRVVNSTETGTMPFELENNTCNNPQFNSTLWFTNSSTVSSLVSGNQSAFIYYQNATAASQSKNPNPWIDPTLLSILHFGEINNLFDSSPHNTYWIPLNATYNATNTTGKWGYATNMSESYRGGNTVTNVSGWRINSTASANWFNITSTTLNRTFTFWAKASTLGSALFYLFYQAQTTNGHVGYSLSWSSASLVLTGGYTDNNACTGGVTATAGTPTANAWHFFAIVFDSAAANWKVYIDNVLNSTTSKTGLSNCLGVAAYAQQPFAIGCNYFGLGICGTESGSQTIVQMDEFHAYNRSMAAAEVSFLYQQGAWLLNETQPVVPVVFVPANGTTINQTNVTETYSVTASLLAQLPCWTTIDNNAPQFVGNLTNATSYVNYTTLADNGGTHNLTLTCQDTTPYNYSNTITFTVWQGINYSAYNANGTAPHPASLSAWASNGTNFAAIAGLSNPAYIRFTSLPNGTINLTVGDALFANYSTNFSVINYDSNYTNVSANLWRNQFFYARNINSNATLASFSINFSNGTVATLNSTSTGELAMPINQLPTGTTTLSWRVSGYGDQNDSLTFTPASAQNFSHYFTPASITIRAYDELSYAQIWFNVSVSNGTQTNTTTLQWAYVQNYTAVPTGVDTIIVSAGNNSYNPRTYYVTIDQYSTPTLAAYLEPSGGTALGVRFHIVVAGGTPVPNALLTIQKTINATSVTVGQQYTDTSGVAYFVLDIYTSYQIIVQKTGYATGSVTLQPVNSDYTLTLSATGGANFSTLFDDISYLLSPDAFDNATINRVNLTILSTNGTLQDFGLNIWYNGTKLWGNQVNTSPSGGSIYVDVNVSNRTDNITAEWYFNRGGYAQYAANRTWQLYNITPADWSLYKNLKDFPAASGASPMVLGVLSLLGTAFVSAFAAPALGFFGAGLVGLTVLGIFAYVGWIVWWIYIMTAIIVIAFIILRGGLG